MLIVPDCRKPDPCGPDYRMEGDDVRIEVKGFMVIITKTDEGVEVSVWPKDIAGAADAITSTYAFDNEV